MATQGQPLTELDAIQDECLMLIMAYLAYRRRKTEYNVRESTKYELILWWIQLYALENEIIMRLCRFDEVDRTKHSLRQALQSRRRDLSAQQAGEIDRRIKKYRTLINPIKTHARNAVIAHRSKSASPVYDPDRWQLEPFIAEVINIVDMIADTTVKYSLSLGRHGLPVDLRAELCS